MPGVGDILRERDRAELRAMTVEERIALAFALGERDARVYASAHGVPVAEAHAILAANRRKGRTPSRCAG